MDPAGKEDFDLNLLEPLPWDTGRDVDAQRRSVEMQIFENARTEHS